MSLNTGSSLAELPPICLLPVNLVSDEFEDIQKRMLSAGIFIAKPLNARLFIARITRAGRAAFELRSRGVYTEAIPLAGQDTLGKRKRSHDDTQAAMFNGEPSNNGLVYVIKLEWFESCLCTKQIQPYAQHIVYQGKCLSKPVQHAVTITMESTQPKAKANSSRLPSSTLGTGSSSRTTESTSALPVMKYSPRRFRDQAHGKASVLSAQHPGLKRSSTSEQNFMLESEKKGSQVAMPDWVVEPHPRPNYSCLRSTFIDPPNKEFLTHLYQIKQVRLLTGDEIGVRAYSTSIASISAYPRKIRYPAEITRLPGCSDKIAALWVEWYLSADPESPDADRHLQVTDELSEDEDVKHLQLFYDIWGVGADTARKFYYNKGWKDLDDVIEHGWLEGALNRAQQIGVKFYDEFLVKLSRPQVEDIADIVLRHARLCRDIPEADWSNAEHDYRGNWRKSDDGRSDPEWNPKDIVCVITGGYRRGKKECGDVDVILSHRDEEVTKDLVMDVVSSLETEGWITHTLTLHTTNSDRDQNTLALKTLDGHTASGFDTLDKALCVWQDPNFDSDKHDKNPNIHRRVDIIVSPWKTVGAAVLGWSGATTFERDIRLWCTKEKGWKYDSSGVRDRVTGAIVDLESPLEMSEISADGWEDRERRLMEGLGIGWRPASERNTG